MSKIAFFSSSYSTGKTIALILEGKGKAAEISVEKISGLGRKTTQLTPVRTQMLSAGSSS